MNARYASFLLLPAGLLAGAGAFAQAPLSAIGQPLAIDFTATVPGVNNGQFQGLPELGAADPAAGQLDLDAWDYFYDGGTGEAANNAAAFPGTLPAGNGYAEGGALATGVSATAPQGQFAFGIQPTGGHFTSGSLTLRVANSTGAAITQVDVAYTVSVFNDQARSNRFAFLYSADNTAGSYVAVPAADVASPADADAAPVWESTPVSFSINGFSIPDGGFLYLRWIGDDISGSGQRDEFALNGITITGQQASGPSLSASVTGLPPFTHTVGSPSAPQSFTVSGASLTGEVTIAVPAPFEVSLAEGSGYVTNIELDPVGGELAGTPVYVRLNGAVAGPWSGAVTVASTGANTLQVNVSGSTTSAGVPVLFINELLASNATGITDEYGEHDDWFEIYNPNAFDVDLAGWYASDDPANITRSRFHPDSTNAVVPAHGWLLVWADNQSAQGNLHANFALSAGGEQVILTAPDGVTVVDQVTFGPQNADESYGRVSDGATSWVVFSGPTPGASNNTVGVAGQASRAGLRLWPVPVSGEVLHADRMVTAVLYDMDGRAVGSVSRSNAVPVAGLAPGVYVLRTEDGAAVRFVKQ